MKLRILALFTLIALSACSSDGYCTSIGELQCAGTSSACQSEVDSRRMTAEGAGCGEQFAATEMCAEGAAITVGTDFCTPTGCGTESQALEACCTAAGVDCRFPAFAVTAM